MSQKNTLENKKKRREERLAKKALREAEELLAITPEERGEASGLVVAQSVLWTPGEEKH